MKKVILFIVTVLLFHFVYSQLDACSYSKLSAAITEYEQLVATFKNAANYEEKESVVAFVELLTKASIVFHKNFGCVVRAYAMSRIGEVTRWRTDPFCYYDPNNPNWDTDVCCNPALTENQCCSPRKVNVTVKGIIGFNDIYLKAKCSTPEKIKTLLKSIFETVEIRGQICNNIVKRQMAKYADVVHQMARCVHDVYSTPKECDSNDDCFSGLCDPTTSKCLGFGLDADPSAVVKCITSNLPEEAVRYLKLKFNLKSTETFEILTTKFKEFLFKEACLGDDNNPTQHISKETCEADQFKLCNDGTSTVLSCTNGSFCGAHMQANGVYKFKIDQLTTKDTCEQYGFCFGSRDNNFYSKANCEAIYRCTDARCAAGCNQASCEATGRCIGFPFYKDTCVSPFKYTKGSDVRACLGEATLFGCLESFYQTKLSCEGAGFNWIKVPTTEQECKGLKFCREGYRFTFKSEADCSKCEGKYENIFRWLGGKWVPSVWVQVFKWASRQVVLKNRWKVLLAPLRLAYFAQRLITFQFLPLFATYARCAFGPFFHLVKTVACDCGDDKGTDCFKEIETIVATFKAFAQSKEKYESLDATIYTNNSIPTEKDSADITVTTTSAVKTEVTTQAAVRSLFYKTGVLADKEVAYIKDSKNRNIGQLVSDGIKLNVEAGTKLTNPVTLCINRQQDIQILDSSYKVAVFAVMRNDKYVATTIDCTNTDSLDQKGCAPVKDGETYYFGYIQQGAERQGSAASVQISWILLLACVLSVLFL